MKVTRGGIVFVVLCCMALIAQLATAQAPIDPGKDPNEVGDVRTEGNGCVTIPDDAYDGSLGSMACFTYPGPSGIITDMNVDLEINHSWVGDLTVKVVSPSLEVLTLMSRPGYAEAADDGGGCCGDSSDIQAISAVTFDDNGATDAEALGSTIAGDQFVCQDDGLCTYFPNPDTGPGTNFAQFFGQPAAGDWMVCVGDGAGGDIGEICPGTVLDITATQGTPTMGRSAMVLMLMLFIAAGMFALRRTSLMG